MNKLAPVRSNGPRLVWKDVAFENGCRAKRAGASLQENIYAKDTEEYHRWNDGWYCTSNSSEEGEI